MEDFKSGFVAILGRTNVRKINFIKFINTGKNCCYCKQTSDYKNTNKGNCK